MRILVNGSWREIAGCEVSAAIAELGYAGIVATAVNGEFVPVSARPDTPLAEGDRLEVLAPMQGG